jgi:hypothetical protein
MKKPIGLPHLSPSAPLALDMTDVLFQRKNNEKLKFEDERKKPRCFKIILNSSDRLDNSTLTKARFKIDLPTQFYSKKLNVMVDSLLHATTPNTNTALESNPWFLSIDEFRNPFSWYSATKNSHGMLLACQQRSYQSSTPPDEGSATLVDGNIFGTPIHLSFSSPHFDITTSVTNPWTVVLSIWDAGLD